MEISNKELAFRRGAFLQSYRKTNTKYTQKVIAEKINLVLKEKDGDFKEIKFNKVSEWETGKLSTIKESVLSAWLQVLGIDTDKFDKDVCTAEIRDIQDIRINKKARDSAVVRQCIDFLEFVIKHYDDDYIYKGPSNYSLKMKHNLFELLIRYTNEQDAKILK